MSVRAFGKGNTSTVHTLHLGSHVPIASIDTTCIESPPSAAISTVSLNIRARSTAHDRVYTATVRISLSTATITRLASFSCRSRGTIKTDKTLDAWEQAHHKSARVSSRPLTLMSLLRLGLWPARNYQAPVSCLDPRKILTQGFCASPVTFDLFKTYCRDCSSILQLLANEN